MVQEESACLLTKGKRMLIAVDGSEYSDIILDQAISIGKICNSDIFVISVIALFPESAAIAPEIEDKLSKEINETLKKVRSRIEENNLKCETIIRLDVQPHNPIVQEAKKRNVDLIVIGTRGMTRLKRVLMGSVAQKVIGYAPCPVMIVPV
jgi:nucleotide-binding universal stress UspA family protein